MSDEWFFGDGIHPALLFAGAMMLSNRGDDGDLTDPWYMFTVKLHTRMLPLYKGRTRRKKKREGDYLAALLNSMIDSGKLPNDPEALWQWWVTGGEHWWLTVRSNHGF